MKLKSTLTLIALVFTILPVGLLAEEPAPYVGDIVLVGTVERSGRRLLNDATLFEGDTLRTAASSGGVLRLGRGRIEIGESTSLKIVRARPLQIRVDFGSLMFNFPQGTEFEFITPQLEVHADPTKDTPASGQIIAIPGEQDRVQSLEGLFYALERQEYGARRRIRAGEVLIAALVPTATIPVARTLPVPQAGEPVAEFETLNGEVFLHRYIGSLSILVGSPALKRTTLL